ncbi:MAG: amidase [Alphaproteobacteria bacterium]|nr:amidase [Alphaproteobacteria bacterium]MBV9694811.1 amidase [Alphaproteobacteria bacterium]
MTELYTTARQLLADLKNRRVSARELLEAHAARQEYLAGSINAVVATNLTRARRDAQAIDDSRSRGETLGPLAGLPMTIKDGFDVEGLPATSGFSGFAQRPKDCPDAELVARTRAAGAVVWGKTNVPFFLSDWQSYNAIYGTTNNPYDVTRVPGGSSGGAAAALACGITPLEIGSDIGGSLRHPANFCGICALKPTWGALPMRGHVPPPPGMDAEVDLGVAGPMARTVDDLKLLWSVLSREPERPRQPVKGMRLAVWDNDPLLPLGRDPKAAVVHAARALADAGAQVETIAAPLETRELLIEYIRLLTSIMAVGYPDQILASMNATRDADLNAFAANRDPWSAELFRLGTTARPDEILAAQRARDTLKGHMKAFFERHDAIVMPVAPVTAFAHDHSEPFNARVLNMDGETIAYSAMLGWIALATALHLPSIAVPTGRNVEGMPVGVQIVGAWNDEARLFDLAAAVEEARGGFSPPATLL